MKQKIGIYTEGESFAVAKAQLLTFTAGTLAKINEASEAIPPVEGNEAAQAALYEAQGLAQTAHSAASDMAEGGGTFKPFREGRGKRVTKKVRSRQ